MKEQGIPIWFFIGALLALYGVLVLGAGIAGLFDPPRTALAHLHAGIWWGALLAAVGGFYLWAFRPGRRARGGSDDHA